nr:AI-2E family transporter [Ornithinimicrobium sp. F0845]
MDRRNVWQVAWTVVAVFLLVRLLLFVFDEASSVLGTIVMSWAASLALEPAVNRVSRSMSRGWATLVVMFSLVVAGAIFLYLFGGMLAEQIRLFAASIPGYVDQLNQLLSQYVDTDRLVDLLGGPLDLGGVAASVAGGLLSFVATLVGSFFSVFTFAFFTYYLSADAPRLRRWLSRLFPPAQQEVVATVWDLAITKTGGYIAARMTLAACSATATAVFLLLIDMPYWLPLGIWTGVVAQFVPTVGTYIAIALPVFIGLVGDRPIQGLFVLIFATLYQQVENLILDPRISSRAVHVHPAISFGSVMLGAALFGIPGAFVAVPTAALILALLEIYTRKYEVLADVLVPPAPVPKPADVPDAPPKPTGVSRFMPWRH